MKLLQRFILLAGFATMALLLWRFKPATIWAQISQVGALGFLAILPFQICDHLLNALGWRFAFSAEDAIGVPFWRLVKVRIAGDGVNYLTPSGTIAGELVRPALLGDAAPAAVKNYSVAVAKFAQALAQMAFILVGLIFVLLGHLNILEGRELALSLAGTCLAMGIIGLALYVLTASGGWAVRLWRKFPNVGALREQMREYLMAHPGRFLLSTVCFMLGYAWGGAEVLLICYFMGLSMSPLAALAVEVFSNIVDSIMFFVPAKVGTQEAGKTAIFKLLGYRASQGLAFGLIRHTREIIWASGGFLYYALNRNPREPRTPPQAKLPPRSKPLSRGN
jgi:hypothetical protein